MFHRSCLRFSQNILKKSQRFSHYDIVIAGGGVMGSSSAYFLKKKEPSLRIAVIEKDCTYRVASSALSASGIRQQFSIPENVKLSQWSYKFMQNISQHLALEENDDIDVGLKNSSYMFLTTRKGVDILSHNCNIQKGCGVSVDLYTADELKEKYPWLNTDDGVFAGSLCAEGEGWFDGYLLLSAFRKKATSMGVKYISGECSKINVSSHVESVRVATKDRQSNISCSLFLNAAGCWAGDLMDSIGVYLPVFPRKRYVYVVDCPKAPGRNMPFLVDNSGVWARPEGQGTLYITGASPEHDEDEPCVSNFDVDYDYFYETVWPKLANRISAFEELKLRHSWSGFYDYNTFDQNAVVGPHPEISNLYFINGFSGHGIQQSPAVGNALSEIILDGKYSNVDLSIFSYDRLINDKPVIEKNII